MHRMKDIKKVQVSTCEVRYKNECHMVFGPVLGHIKIQGQIQPTPTEHILENGIFDHLTENEICIPLERG